MPPTPFYRRPFFILGAAWVALQLFLCYQFGIVTDFEASKYLAQADHLLAHGRYESGNYLFYSTQILLIAACKKMGVGYAPAIGVQMLFNALSLVCFYRTLMGLTQNAKAAFAFTAGLLGMYYYQLYNVHLFTESLYFSFSVIFFYGLTCVRRLGPLAVGGILLGLSVLYLTRPVGLFFVPATFLYVVFRFYPRRAALLMATAGGALLAAFYVMLNRSLNAGGEFDFLLPYLDERVICGVPTVSPPHRLEVPVEQDSVEGLFYVITHHWRLFAGLSVRRLAAFFGVMRPWFSWPHNLFVCAYFYTVYGLIALGLRRWRRRHRPHVSFCLSLVLLTALTAALSCDEWHNRFILAVLPFLLLPASLIFARKTADPDGEPEAA